jgi:hypothetical protein
MVCAVTSRLVWKDPKLPCLLISLPSKRAILFECQHNRRGHWTKSSVFSSVMVCIASQQNEVLVCLRQERILRAIEWGLRALSYQTNRFLSPRPHRPQVDHNSTPSKAHVELQSPLHSALVRDLQREICGGPRQYHESETFSLGN